ncbi:NAD(P)-dependent oxidoreductase [Nocardioides sp.]|uniref:NAD-dependent epimerase/dehydratase family protein n=1 Tax=Nocardioides sp. TaxID=35761 RepID=UPI002C66350F|nr:NAD(P)-dependent oxidoreductase [Nocardioides sp.]HXH77212.1 NAD(P)-dependent oxidoreductase [Nocardioides sp.]
MKVLITGGCGFIGQHLARRLVRQGSDVVALDVLNPQVHLEPESSRLAFPGAVVVGDIASPDAWDAVSNIGSFGAVVHLAAETGTGQSMYEHERYRRTNVDGTRSAGLFASSHDIPLVSLSSRAVYGEGAPDRPSYEDDPHQPVSFYGETKSLAEQEVAGFACSVPITTIRPQNVIGPGQALHNPYTGVLAAFLAMLREQRPLTVYGDGSQTRDFIHVQDLAELVVWCLEHPAVTGEQRVLNSGTGTRTTLLELARLAVAASPHDVGVEHLAVSRAGDINHACASLDRLRTVGAPEPRWSPADAVTEFIQWSWDRPGASSSAWDQALGELSDRGLVE